jgi:hypothetical protein
MSFLILELLSTSVVVPLMQNHIETVGRHIIFMDNFQLFYTRFVDRCYFCHAPAGYRYFAGNVYLSTKFCVNHDCSEHGAVLFAHRSGDNMNIVSYIYG